MTQTKKKPTAGNRGLPKDSISGESSPILADASALVDHVHVVVTSIVTTDGMERYRRHVYWSLNNAQRALDRASMAGRAAEMVLCQLVPVKGGDSL